MNKFVKTIRAAVLPATAVILAACGGSGGATSSVGPGGGSNNEVCSTNTICMDFLGSYGGAGSGSFNPATLTIPKGTTVTFTNNSGVTHNVVFDTNAPTGGDIGTIDSGSQTRTFSTAGTVNFHCTIHAGMSGQIIVQ